MVYIPYIRFIITKFMTSQFAITKSVTNNEEDTDCIIGSLLDEIDGDLDGDINGDLDDDSMYIVGSIINNDISFTWEIDNILDYIKYGTVSSQTLEAFGLKWCMELEFTDIDDKDAKIEEDIRINTTNNGPLERPYPNISVPYYPRSMGSGSGSSNSISSNVNNYQYRVAPIASIATPTTSMPYYYTVSKSISTPVAKETPVAKATPVAKDTKDTKDTKDVKYTLDSSTIDYNMHYGDYSRYSTSSNRPNQISGNKNTVGHSMSIPPIYRSKIENDEANISDEDIHSAEFFSDDEITLETKTNDVDKMLSISLILENDFYMESQNIRNITVRQRIYMDGNTRYITPSLPSEATYIKGIKNNDNRTKVRLTRLSNIINKDKVCFKLHMTHLRSIKQEKTVSEYIDNALPKLSKFKRLYTETVSFMEKTVNGFNNRDISIDKKTDDIKQMLKSMLTRRDNHINLLKMINDLISKGETLITTHIPEILYDTNGEIKHYRRQLKYYQHDNMIAKYNKKIAFMEKMLSAIAKEKDNVEDNIITVKRLDLSFIEKFNSEAKLIIKECGDNLLLNYQKQFHLFHENLRRGEKDLQQYIELGLDTMHVKLFIANCKKSIQKVLANIDDTIQIYIDNNMDIPDIDVDKSVDLKMELSDMPIIITADSLICPITHDTIHDPVVLEDGYTYERSEIEKWLAKSNISPMTGNNLKDKTLKPNQFMRQLICSLK